MHRYPSMGTRAREHDPSMAKDLSESHSRDRRTLVMLSVAAFASMASMRYADSILPALAMDFDTTTSMAAGVISAFALGYGLLTSVLLGFEQRRRPAVRADAARSGMLSTAAAILRIARARSVLAAAWTLERFSATPLFACASAGLFVLAWTFVWLLPRREDHEAGR
jgi:hypothetical protein